MTIEYRKGNSTLHDLDARTKLLIFIGLTLLAVIIIDPILIAVLFVILYLFGLNSVNPDTLNRNLRVLVAIFLTFSMFQIFFFTPDDAYFLFHLIPGTNWIPVTVQGIIRGIAVFFRFFIVVLSVHLMLYTTPPVELVLALTRQEQRRSIIVEARIATLLGIILLGVAYLTLQDKIQQIPLEGVLRVLCVFAAAVLAGFIIYRITSHGLPAEMGVALSLGFATVGILSKQTQKITDAQKARGYDVQPKNLIQRVRVLTALLLPIFLATLERSQDISVAILARAFDYNIAKRTYRRQLYTRTADYVVQALMVFLLLGGLTLSYFEIGNPTEQLVLLLLH